MVTFLLYSSETMLSLEVPVQDENFTVSEEDFKLKPVLDLLGIWENFILLLPFVLLNFG